jgi:hypothetical protein
MNSVFRISPVAHSATVISLQRLCSETAWRCASVRAPACCLRASGVMSEKIRSRSADTGMYDLDALARSQAPGGRCSRSGLIDAGAWKFAFSGSDCGGRGGEVHCRKRPADPRGGAVQLPEHMRRIVNTVGASYFYFEKFQGTAAAWPRVRFPKCEPLTEEFAKRVAQLPRLVAEKADTAWKWFFTDAVNSRRDLPSPAGVAAGPRSTRPTRPARCCLPATRRRGAR